MKSLVDIAIESNAEIGTWDKSGNGQKLISFTHAELKAFAEACLNEWLKEQKVELIHEKYLAASEHGMWLYTFYSDSKLSLHERLYVELPSEEK